VPRRREGPPRRRADVRLDSVLAGREHYSSGLDQLLQRDEVIGHELKELRLD